MTARSTLAVVLALVAVLTGCQSSTPGTPITSPKSPTEPNFPTSRPTRPTAAPTKTLTPAPTKTLTPAPTTTAAAPGAEVLPPENGYVFVETKSGKTRCQLSTAEVGCEAQFTTSPVMNGMHANGVRVTADGEVSWLVGNLGDIPAVTLDYRTYSAVGWTIQASEDGTRFTNDGTGHGMIVAIEGVQAF